MNKIELLSPVGGYEQFIAAVESGADAVYLGGSYFNARNSATNFSDEELEKAIKYAHARGVKVHLTLNILLHDSEIKEAINQVAGKEVKVRTISADDYANKSIETYGSSPKLSEEVQDIYKVLRNVQSKINFNIEVK